jgi:DNA-binding SARP family transcriptional activator
MDSSRFSQCHTRARISGASSLISLVERGLHYFQQGSHAEGVAILALAREHLTADQISLADALDVFLQEYAGYRHMQQALQEVSMHFAQAHAELQERVTALGEELPILMRNIDTTLPLHTEVRVASPPSPSQNHQVQPFSLMPSPLEKNITLPELSVTCFGHFEVKRFGEPIVLCSSRNGKTILRYLVAKAGHSASSDTLQAVLWPEDEPEVAKRKLHIAVSALRRSLDQGVPCDPACSYVVCKHQVYSLNSAATIRTDVEEFLEYYHTGKRMSENRAAFYERACSLYTGPFLSEDRYADWSFLEREQLNQIYLAMCHELADYYLKIKRYEDATKWATQILKENQCDEAAHRQLICIYIDQGRRSEALQQYRRCERLLREELGAQPLAETVLLIQALLINDPPATQE